MAYQQLPSHVPVTPDQAKRQQETGRKAAVGCGAIWLAITFLFAWGALARGGLGALFLVPFVAVGIGILAWGLAPTIRAWKITAPDISLTPETARLGETIDFRYNQVLKDRLDVDYARITFVMRETAIYRRGTDTYTETHEIPVETKEVSGGTYRAGEQLNIVHQFVVPRDGMHTFIAAHNRIEWLIKIKVSIARWPDVEETYPILVLPEQYRDFRAEDR